MNKFNPLSKSRRKRSVFLLILGAATYILFTTICSSSLRYHEDVLDFINFSDGGQDAENGKERVAGAVMILSPEEGEETERKEEVETSKSNVTCYKSPMLPKRVYTVIGLEASGTKFVTDIIREALGLKLYRNGAGPFKNYHERKPYPIDYEMEKESTHVQHLSLPFGSHCTAVEMEGKEVPIVDVILPAQCVRTHNDDSEEVKTCCDAMAQELLGFNPEGKRIQYPLRWNLDIVSHKEWNDAHGVDQWMVIVLRDKDISAASRVKSKHCTVKELLEKEEEAGKAIIIDAINKYILGEGGERKVTSENYEFWYAERFHGRKLREIQISDTSSMIPSKNKVVVVSYEAMMLLGDVYFKSLYKTLGIETNHKPNAKNGNTRYVADSPYATRFSRTDTRRGQGLKSRTWNGDKNAVGGNAISPALKGVGNATSPALKVAGNSTSDQGTEKAETIEE